MRYLILLIFISCNSSMETREPVMASPNNSLSDSVGIALDSLKMSIVDLSELSDFAKEAQAKIKRLEKEKQATEKEIEVYPMAMMSDDYHKDDRDRVIAELRKKVYQYETEIASLKNQLYREQVKVDRVPNKEVEKPNDSSLVIALDGTEKGATVWIVPYNRKTKKEIERTLKGYYNCQLKDLNSMDARQAKFYNGLYFFNDVEKGKYLIKVCALYGDYMVFKREEKYQLVAMKISPPIQ